MMRPSERPAGAGAAGAGAAGAARGLGVLDVRGDD